MQVTVCGSTWKQRCEDISPAPFLICVRCVTDHLFEFGRLERQLALPHRERGPRSLANAYPITTFARKSRCFEDEVTQLGTVA